jgi:hypothetical protein
MIMFEDFVKIEHTLFFQLKCLLKILNILQKWWIFLFDVLQV